MTDAALDLDTLGADVEWTDPVAARVAREQVPESEGRLAALHEWLAATQGAVPVRPPARPRCVIFGTVSDAAQAICDELGVGIRCVTVVEGWSVAEALAAGVAAADEEVEGGADLVVVADPDTAAPATVLVSVLTGVEPVALLPRGAGAVDTSDWIGRATRLRDARRKVAALRDEPDDLLGRLGHAPLAATTGFVLRATARRTPLVLDGVAALAAALLAYTVQPRAARWWLAADTSSNPVLTKAAAALDLRPVLALGSVGGDGIAGALTVALLRAAAQIGLAP